MSKLIMTLGLPASGKSTWAKEQVSKGGGRIVRVNKDSLRTMFHADIWDKKRENFTVAARDELVRLGLKLDKTVIVDDTNLAPDHEKVLRFTAEDNRAEFEIQDFTDVPLAVCLERDADRTVGRVGRKVIVEMWEKYLHKKPVPPAYIDGVPDAILCDLDGTIAEMVNRGPFDANVENDLPRRHVIRAVFGLAAGGAHIFFVSGRKEEARQSTTNWLVSHVTPRLGDGSLLMRRDDDNRRDSIVETGDLRHAHRGEVQRDRGVR